MVEDIRKKGREKEKGGKGGRQEGRKNEGGKDYKIPHYF